MAAVRMGHLEVARRLLAGGADRTLRSPGQHTALDFADSDAMRTSLRWMGGSDWRLPPGYGENARMVTHDARIDAYLEAAPDFAKPVLSALRAAIHAACPDVVETIKWRNPSFEYHGLLCAFAAFQRHCSFGFWKHTLVCGDTEKGQEAWGSFGRLTSVADLPSKAALAKLIRKAMQLNVDGVKVAKPKHARKPAPKMPPALEKALRGHARARTHWAAFTPGKQREYMEWIGEAKTDATRTRRLEQALEWIAEGKPRNWKYMDC